MSFRAGTEEETGSNSIASAFSSRVTTYPPRTKDKNQNKKIQLLHEVLLPVLVAVLIARRRHVILVKQVVVRVLLLPLLLLSLLGYARLFLFLYIREGKGEKRADRSVKSLHCKVRHGEKGREKS